MMICCSCRDFQVAWPPGGCRLATGSGDRLLTLPATIAEYNLLFTPDGKWLPGNQMGRKVMVWER